MIQSILFFTLGFLCAGFLALMVAPAIWRRAVALTRKRIEASVPLTLTDIQADKDRMRAEFAMSTRRLEMSIKAFKDKAAAQIIEINRNREELKRLAAEREGQNQSLSELEAKAGELRGELRQREDQLQRLTSQAAPRPRRRSRSGRSSSKRWAGSMTRPASPPATARSNSWCARPRSRSSPATCSCCAASARRPTAACRKSPPRARPRAMR